MRLFLFCCHLCATFTYLHATVDFAEEKVQKNRKKESQRIFKKCQQNIGYYTLETNQLYRDITEQLLASSNVAEKHKSKMIEQQRHIVLFTYPSDGHAVKGYISYTPEHKQAPLLFFLRGGNRILGLMNPANDFSFMKNYTVIATTYRGGINERQDEFGGEEVNDIENLVHFIPELTSMLDVEITPRQKFILGASRGGMQMFLALQRSLFLQNYFDKCICLSGPTDLKITISQRKDMENMFVKDFGLILDKNIDKWLFSRSPICHCSCLKKELPILIIQGTKDHRTHLSHGRNMFDLLSSLGNQVTYWEIAEATHCLSNQKNRIEIMTSWLEEK